MKDVEKNKKNVDILLKKLSELRKNGKSENQTLQHW